MKWPDSIKKLVASMNLCESSTLEFLEKQFQNEFEILSRSRIMMSLPIPEPPSLQTVDDFMSINSQMPVFLPPPPVKLAIDTVEYRKSLKEKIKSFLNARENDFLFTLMFRRC